MIPDFKVFFGESDSTEVIRPILEKIEVEDKAGVAADACYIHLKATEILVIPETGTDVKVSLGYSSPKAEIWEVFKGVANRTGLRGPPDLLIIQATGVALSDDKRLQGSHERSWNDATLGEIVTDIIQGAGFRARVHSDLKGVELKRAIQSIESDIEVLTRLVEAYGGILKSDGETVAVVPRDSLESASGEKLPEVTIDKSVCEKYSWGKRQRSIFKSVVAFYQDEEQGETRAHIAGSGQPEKRLKQIFNSEDAAKTAAEKELGLLKHINSVRLTTTGRDVAVGSPLRITGFPRPITSEYQVTRVKHSWGDGYTVNIEAEGE